MQKFKISGLFVMAICLVATLFHACKRDASAPAKPDIPKGGTRALYGVAESSFCHPYTPQGVIAYIGKSNLTISNDSIYCGASSGISLTNCNHITIRKCRFQHCTNTSGAIYLNNCSDITIDSSVFDDVIKGVNIKACTNNIKVTFNRFSNVADQAGTPNPSNSQAIQFNTTTGANLVASNNFVYTTGIGGLSAGIGDVISVYKSNGTAASPLRIDSNEIRGGSSAAFSGIVLGSGGGDYQEASYNFVVSSGSSGMRVQGGNHINMNNNTIFGAQTTASGTGLLYANFSGLTSSDITIGGNNINWTNSSGTKSNLAYSTTHGETQPTNWATNVQNSDAVNDNILPNPLWTPCVNGSCAVYTASPVLSYNGAHDFDIVGDSIYCGSSRGIVLNNCYNVNIRNCRFQHCTTGNGAIYLYNCNNITINNCYFDDVVKGVNIMYCTGYIKVTFNRFSHVSDKSASPNPRNSQAIQFNNSTGAGMEACRNFIYTDPLDLGTGDLINVYKSSGISTSPIRVDSNKIRGGGTDTPGYAAIVLGDLGGDYQQAKYNIVCNSGYVGMQVQGGNHINMSNNTIYGAQTVISHLGLGYGNFSGTTSSDITMQYNSVNWTDKTGVKQNMFYHGSVQPTGWTTNIQNSPAVNDAILPNPLWKGCNLWY